MDSSTLRFRITAALELRKSLNLVWRYAAGWTSVNALLVFVQGLLPIAAFYLMKQIVDAVSFILSLPEKGSADYSALIFWVSLAALTALCIAVARSLSTYTSTAQSEILSDKIADILHRKSVEIDLGYYENPAYYNSLHRAQEEAPYRLPDIVDGLIEISRSSIALIGILGLLLSFNGFLVLALLLATLPVAIIRLTYSQKSFDLDKAQTEPERRAGYYHSVLTDVAEAKEIRAFNLGNLFRDWYQELKKTIRQEKLTLLRSRVAMDILSQLIVVVTLFGSISLIITKTIQGEATIGELVAFYLAFQGGLNYMQAVFYAFADLYEDNLFLSNLYAFLDLKPHITAPSKPEPLPKPVVKGLVVKGLGYTYPGSTRPALKDVDFTLKPGEVIAFAGKNGSGKSTIVKLLCRLYDPEEGRILLDDVEVSRFDPYEWRKKFSFIFQDYAHYALSVKENIWLGNIECPAEEKKIKQAAVFSGASSFIDKLPFGYNTQLGRWFTEGHEISIGEWQKIALARTFWRDAEILVFDEPSSSLDPIAEDLLFRNFKSLLKGRSAILISHRFSTLQIADRIYVMKEGNIIETGTHKELLGRDSYYADLYNVQAKYYGTG